MQKYENQRRRLRFAPSPTGALHIGGIRTALYNYLLARQSGGDFILRIEDTDQTRYVPGAEEYIMNALKWVGLNPDEGVNEGGPYGPYRQSERTKIYQEHAWQLVKNGKAYLAFDTPEELEAGREKLISEGVAVPKYDALMRSRMRNSLTLSKEETQALVDANTPFTIRLLVEPGHTIHITDNIRGDVSFESSELDDKVLLKADGFPTYHLANVVDDHTMQITDVIRGEEWLPSTAHHVLLYRAFGWEDTMPAFSHLPLILKPDGKGKLSKRDGQKFGFPVFPLAWPGYSEEESFEGFDSYGFEPEALVNFLAFLGWNPGTEQEIFSLDQLIAAFDTERIHKAGARFDFEKALWYNQQYVQHLSFSNAKERLEKDLSNHGWNADVDTLERVFDLMKPRVHLLKQIVEQGSYFFTSDFNFAKEEIAKKWNDAGHDCLMTFASQLESTSQFHQEENANLFKATLEQAGLKMGNVMPLLRAALSGNVQGPDVFAIADILGKEETIRRIKTFKEKAGF